MSRSRVVLVIAVAGVLAGAAVGALTAGAQPAVELKTEEQKTLYAIGLAVSSGLAPFALSATDLELVKAGITDGVLNRQRQVDLQAYMPRIQEMQKARASVVAAAEQKAGQAVLDKAAGEKGATKTPSGLVIVPIKPGTGPSPKATDRVKVHYKGSLRDGTEFDSSLTRGEAASFHLNRVVPCWTEGVQKMKVGGKARLVCPAELGYGERGVPGRIPAGAALVFEVELLEILPEVAATPPAAQKPAAKPAAKPAPKAE
jgi:FKBP-type peptidyl-prolyl cis-trans isomerase FkpA/FKBP-type peptidyl-prolyl cis-trans isomerase FklB